MQGGSPPSSHEDDADGERGLLVLMGAGGVPGAGAPAPIVPIRLIELRLEPGLPTACMACTWCRGSKPSALPASQHARHPDDVEGRWSRDFMHTPAQTRCGVSLPPCRETWMLLLYFHLA